MEKISNNISKKVISLNEGEFIGYILDAVFDEDLDSLQGFLVVDDESEETFILNKENIKSVGDDCIMMDSTHNLKRFFDEDTFNPIGKNVYDANGVYLGTVIDVVVQGRAVRRIITDKCEFFKRNIRKIGKNNIIFGKKSLKNTKRQALFVIDESLNQKVTTLSVKEKQSKPYRIFANQSSIIGRTMTSDLYGYNNEIIAKKFDIINQNIINRAKLHNKLNFVLYYSK